MDTGAPIGPLLTAPVWAAMRAAVPGVVEVSLDLGRTTGPVAVDAAGFVAEGARYPWPAVCKERTVYHWDGADFVPVARFGASLIKLVPTEWGPPTFEIDGVKMLPTARVSPYADAQAKVALIQPRGKVILDTCGGLGYFAAWCLRGEARRIRSFEANPDVVWLRRLNPWSPPVGGALELTQGDVTAALPGIGDGQVDAILHDPPRFGLAGELYAEAFYAELARVLSRKGRMFHYTGAPNKLTSGRDVPNEVAKRLRRVGFSATLHGDGVLAVRG